ncbi:MAG: sigma-70 family RNA polymerase sigma factor [Bacteroidales bacterium]|nr:sigma-70 family RNA polymerase sigma factor [Bacteroidales bacterium]
MNSRDLKEEFVFQIEKHQGIIYKVSRMYCDNDQCQKDLFQDILFQLWQSYPSFNEQSKFSTWMYRVALNTAIAQFRKDKKNNEDPVPELPVNIPAEETYKEKESRKEIVHWAINKLSKAEKAIIILYMDDYTYEEISEIAGITMSNVGVKINRIKIKLQKILKELDYGL